MCSLFCRYGSGGVIKQWTKVTLKLSSMLDMLFHFMAFPYMHYSQSYGTSNTKECDFEKWVEYQGHAYVRDKNNRAAVYVGELYLFCFHKSWLSNLLQGLYWWKSEKTNKRKHTKKSDRLHNNSTLSTMVKANSKRYFKSYRSLYPPQQSAERT